MTVNGLLQLGLYVLVLVACVKPLGWYMARVYENKPCGLDRIFYPLEKWIYGISGIHPEQEMDWKKYLMAMLVFNFLGAIIVYAIQRLQGYLPLNPQHFPAVSPGLAFNTAASFVTNTDWQAYGGESTLSYITQMTALTVQNFLSAATGMALLAAFIRGLIRHETNNLGNFWTDTVRGTLYILLPLSLLLAVALSAQGVIQNFRPYQKVSLLQPFSYQPPQIKVTEQVIPMGPVASQIAIKQLGTNGGGFFNANSAHPYENPTPLTNFLEMLAILLIPAALCYTFGVMANDKRQGWAIFTAMLIIWLPLTMAEISVEQKGNPALSSLQAVPASNLEGKETRLGILNSSVWTTATTATSNGSVNAMLDSFTPLGGLIPLWLMHLGEVIFGGVGSGLSGMLVLIIVTVFVAGLMVGRAPEYVGKKIESYEMKMAAAAVLIMPLIVLLLTAMTVLVPVGVGAIANPAAHGFSEILYALTSMGNNNGSAFAGLNANVPFYNIIGGIEILLLRFWIAIPTLAIAGSLVRKKSIPVSAGTLPTHTPLFVIMLVSVTVIVGALTFFPALALGPIVEHLTVWGTYGR